MKLMRLQIENLLAHKSFLNLFTSLRKQNNGRRRYAFSSAIIATELTTCGC